MPNNWAISDKNEFKSRLIGFFFNKILEITFHIFYPFNNSERKRLLMADCAYGLVNG